MSSDEQLETPNFWQQLGEAVYPTSNAIEQTKQWSHLLSFFEGATLTPDQQTLIASINLDALGNLNQAATILSSVKTTSAFVRFQRLRIALEQGDLAAYRTWAESELAIVGEGETPMCEALLAVYSVLHDKGSAISLPKQRRHPFADWMFENLAFYRGTYPELDLFLSEGTAPDEKLFEAFVVGDCLKEPARAETILTAISEAEPMFVGEKILDMAWGCDAAAEVGKTLAQRFKLLTKAEFLPEAEATKVFLRIFRLKETPGNELQTLSDGSADGFVRELDGKQTVSAWGHLIGLLNRQALFGEGGALAQVYLDQAKLTQSPLRDVLLLRAIEHLMTQSAWEEALKGLEMVAPSGKSVSPTISKLTTRYQLLCLMKLERWSSFGESLLKLVDGVESKSDKMFLLATVALLATKEPALLPKLKDASTKSADVATESVGWFHLFGVLLSLSKQDDLSSLSAMWQTMMAQRSLASSKDFKFYRMAAVSVLLATEQGAQALTTLERISTEEKEEPLVRIAQAYAYLLLEQWTNAVASFEAAARSLSREKRRDVLRMIAAIAKEKIGIDRASQLYSRLLDDTPDDFSALIALAQLRYENKRFRDGIDLLNRAARFCSNSTTKRGLLLGIAETLRVQLKDASGAEAAYREGLKLAPSDPQLLAGLRELLTQTGRIAELAPVLNTMLHAIDDPLQKLELHLESAKIYRKLWERNSRNDDAEQSMMHCDAALKLDHLNERAVRDYVYLCIKLARWSDLVERHEILIKTASGSKGLRKAYETLEEWERLAVVCHQIAMLSDDPSEKLKADLQAGDLYRRKLNDKKRAEQCYRDAAENDALAREPLERLADLYRETLDGSNLVQVLERVLVRTESLAQQNAMRLELGKVYAERLGRREEARVHFRTIVEHDPTHREAIDYLEKLLDEEGLQTERTRVLEKMLQMVEGKPESLSVLLKLGQAYLEVKDERAALRIASRMQSAFPTDSESFRFAEAVYETQNRFSELCELYSKRIAYLEKERTRDDELAMVLEKKGGVELEKLGAPAEAAESFSRVLDLRPDEQRVLRRLEEILAEGGRWHRLIAVYERHAGNLVERNIEPRLAVEYLQRAAKIAQNYLRDEAETVRLYERIHALDPTHADAFQILEKRLERQNDYRQLVALLLERAKLVANAEEELKCILRAGSVCEKVDIPQAVQLYQRALTINPASVIALEALARIYESLEQWQELLDITGSQIQLEADSNRRAFLYFKCGSVMETQYHDDESAFRYYSDAVKSSAACLPALHGLRDLHARRGEWSKVIDTLETEVRIWADPKGKADVLAQIAEIFASKLKDRSKALRYYKKAAKTHEECMAAAIALFEYYAEAGVYAEAARWGEIYARKGQSRGSAEQRAAFYIRRAEVLRNLDRPQEAAHSLVQALEAVALDHDALFELLELCRTHRKAYDFRTLFADLIKDAAKHNDATAQAILSCGAGLIAESSNHADEALRLYRTAVEAINGDFRIVRPLADLLVVLGKEKQALDIVEQCRAQSSKEHAQHLEATVWVGHYWMTYRTNYERAITEFRAAIEAHPYRLDIRETLAAALSLGGKPSEAATEIEQLCNQLAAKGDHLDLLARQYHTLGIAAYKSGNAKGAEANWRRSYELVPSFLYPYVSLARKLAATGDSDGAERELKLADQGLEEKSPDLYRAQAEFYARQGYVDRAITLYRKGIKLGDKTVDDHVNLARHIAARGDTKQALEVLRSTIQTHGNYVPAYHQMKTLLSAAKQDEEAQRVAQVLYLGVGTSWQRPVKAHKSVDAKVWKHLYPLVCPSMIDSLWDALGGEIARQFSHRVPVSRDPANDELRRICDSLSAALSMKNVVKIAAEDNAPLVSSSVIEGETHIVLEKQAEHAAPEVQRVLLMVALGALNLGQGYLLGLTHDERVNLGQLLAILLLPRRQWPPEAAKIFDNVSRREQKLHAKLATQQQALDPAQIAALAHEWAHGLETVWLKTALLLTEDLPAVAQTWALMQGIEPASRSPEGMLLAFPEVQTLTQYFVSEAFETHRTALMASV